VAAADREFSSVVVWTVGRLVDGRGVILLGLVAQMSWTPFQQLRWHEYLLVSR